MGTSEGARCPAHLLALQGCPSPCPPSSFNHCKILVFDHLFVSGTWQSASPLIVHNWQGGSGEGLRDCHQRLGHDQHRLLPLPLVWCCLPGETILFHQIRCYHVLPPQIILKTEDDEEKSVASVSAVLFFVLALQTGLTGMEGEKRFQQV